DRFPITKLLPPMYGFAARSCFVHPTGDLRQEQRTLQRAATLSPALIPASQRSRPPKEAVREILHAARAGKVRRRITISTWADHDPKHGRRRSDAPATKSGRWRSGRRPAARISRAASATARVRRLRREPVLQGNTDGMALSPSRYDAIVIGAGHNVLVNACYLARDGLRVLVLERRYVVVVACVTEETIPCLQRSTP